MLVGNAVRFVCTLPLHHVGELLMVAYDDRVFGACKSQGSSCHANLGGFVHENAVVPKARTEGGRDRVRRAQHHRILFRERHRSAPEAPQLERPTIPIRRVTFCKLGFERPHGLLLDSRHVRLEVVRPFLEEASLIPQLP